MSGTEVSFSGRDYIVYDFNAQTHPTLDSLQTKLKVRFKTIHANGLLLFSQGTNSDFLQLELKEGTIRYVGFPLPVSWGQVCFKSILIEALWSISFLHSLIF